MATFKLGRLVNVLITGHAGFLGRHIGQSLTAEGVDWIGLDRTPSPTAKNQIMGDIRSVHAVAGQLPDLKLIIHLASPVGVRETSADHCATRKEIVEGAAEVAALALRARAKLLFFSSSEVFGEAGGVIDHSTPRAPLSGYGRGKQEAEELIGSLVDDPVVIRPFNVYGPGQRDGFIIANIIHRLWRNEAIQLVKGGQAVRQFTYVGDVVEAVRRIRQEWPSAQRVIHVAGPEAVTIAHVVELAGQITGRSISVSTVDPQDLGRDPAAEVYVRTTIPDVLGGWSPTTTIAHGLRLTLAAAGHDGYARGPRVTMAGRQGVLDPTA